ncbi:hypothetical protein DFP73DRAFT_629897 [Morchella snyderi]|nr:hypothetical protein DFP73DRAFT_629897 [Morchella snyderi]
MSMYGTTDRNTQTRVSYLYSPLPALSAHNDQPGLTITTYPTTYTSPTMGTPFDRLTMTSALLTKEDYVQADASSNIPTLEAALTTLSTKRTNINLRCVKLRVTLARLTVGRYQARVSQQHELEGRLARELVAGESEIKVHLMRLEALKKNVATVEVFLKKAREKAASEKAACEKAACEKVPAGGRPGVGKRAEAPKTEEQKAMELQKAEIQRKREIAGIAEAIARYEFEDGYGGRYI